MLICGDTLTELKKLQSNSVHLVLTDPPYHYDKMEISNWNPVELEKTTQKQQVKSLPGGMKFDPNQGRKFYDFYRPICEELYRVIKPGGFFFSFSAARFYHRMACAIEDSYFNVRDCFMWLYTKNQPKAMSVTRFNPSIPSNWKTPQVKSCFEPICVAQKPPEGTYHENFEKYGVGLINTDIKLGDGMFPANCVSTDEIDGLDKYFLVKKPDKKEKGEGNNHKTVKPLAICEHLIRLTSQPEQVVLDCFSGSGTTLVAAASLDRKWIGIDVNEAYLGIANNRLNCFSHLM